MTAIKDLMHSEKGLLGVLLLIGATVLTALGRMSIQQWLDFTQIVFGIYVVGKTVQGVFAKPEAPKAQDVVDSVGPQQ